MHNAYTEDRLIEQPAIGMFAELVEPMSRCILQLYPIIQNLRRTRDLLLPRLLSGQIDVEAVAS